MDPKSYFPFPSITSLVSIKLTNSNYLLWKSKFMPILLSQDLFGYIDGSIPAPPKSIPSATDPTKIIPNPAYTNWLKVDQLLISWINATLSEDVLAQTVGLSSSRDIWISLDKSFSQHSKAR